MHLKVSITTSECNCSVFVQCISHLSPVNCIRDISLSPLRAPLGPSLHRGESWFRLHAALILYLYIYLISISIALSIYVCGIWHFILLAIIFKQKTHKKHLRNNSLRRRKGCGLGTGLRLGLKVGAGVRVGTVGGKEAAGDGTGKRIELRASSVGEFLSV